MKPAVVNPQNLPTGRTLRAAVLGKGYTYESFAQEKGFSVATVYAVAAGRRGKRRTGMSARIQTALASILTP